MHRHLAATLLLALAAGTAAAQQPLPAPAPAPAAAPRAAERITVQVRGMVCAFCAQGLDKIFKDERGVASVDVSLDMERMVIQLKPGAVLEDARIRKLVGDAGFDVLQIDRDRP